MSIPIPTVPEHRIVAIPTGVRSNFVLGAMQTVSASIATYQRLLDSAATMQQIAAVSEALVLAFRQGHKILLFGNGGSAGDAQHIAAEFVGRFMMERTALPASALTVNTSCLTAIANDYGYDLVFARQLDAFGRPGDIAIGISTSGNSSNVLSGLARARQIGMTTVALTGESGGKMRQNSDYCICVPSQETPRIQEGHILVGHIIAELVERAIVQS